LQVIPFGEHSYKTVPRIAVDRHRSDVVQPAADLARCLAGGIEPINSLSAV
jgi:hypothetical protein